MIKILIGDMFKSEAQTLINTVNCVGIMGKGIALEFKKRFPEMFKDYVKRCTRGIVKLGEPYLYKSLTRPWILNFPTKEHWRSVSRISDITAGFKYLLDHYHEWGITSLAVPPLGCGQGQLEWKVVGPTLYRYLDMLDIAVDLYAPYGTARNELQLDFLSGVGDQTSMMSLCDKPGALKPGWIALVEIVKHINKERFHWPVGRTMFQKIAYVATHEGIPTELKHEKASFGPFSRELKGVMTRLVNNGLIQENRHGNMFEIKVGPTFDDARHEYEQFLTKWNSSIEKVADLFMRLNTKESEIVATILFTEQNLKYAKKSKPSESEVLQEFFNWKQRRRPRLDRVRVAATIRGLAALNWLDVEPTADLLVEETLA